MDAASRGCTSRELTCSLMSPACVVVVLDMGISIHENDVVGVVFGERPARERRKGAEAPGSCPYRSNTRGGISASCLLHELRPGPA